MPHRRYRSVVVHRVTRMLRWPVGGSITNLHVKFDGSRQATKLLWRRCNLGYKLLNKSPLDAGSARHGRAIKPGLAIAASFECPGPSVRD